MIKICRWVYGANAPDDGIVMEPAPHEEGRSAWNGHSPARVQARWLLKSGARDEVREVAALKGIVAIWSAHEAARSGRLLQKPDLNRSSPELRVSTTGSSTHSEKFEL